MWSQSHIADAENRDKNQSGLKIILEVGSQVEAVKRHTKNVDVDVSAASIGT